MLIANFQNLKIICLLFQKIARKNVIDKNKVLQRKQSYCMKYLSHVGIKFMWDSVSGYQIQKKKIVLGKLINKKMVSIKK